MKSVYGLIIARCGLSHTEAAAFNRVRPDTVRSWVIDRNRAPDGAVAEVRALYAKIERAADQAVQQIAALAARHAPADIIELGLASDDHEAQTLGWPCVSVHAAVLGLVAARVPARFVIVPRGSTVATAAAEAAHLRPSV